MIYRPTQLILSIFTCFFICCGHSDEQAIKSEADNQADTIKSDSTDFEIIEQDLIEEQRAQVYVIEKKAVVFFMVSKKEMKEIIQGIGDSYRWESEALFNNFKNQVDIFQSLLKKHNINCELSNNNQFEIKLKDGKVVGFNRIDQDQILGEIITDGVQEPLIEYGMFSNSELVKLLQDFYKIENLGYVPPDSTENKEPEIPPESDR